MTHCRQPIDPKLSLIASHGKRVACPLCWLLLMLMALPVSAQDRELTEQQLSEVSGAIDEIQGWLERATTRQSREQERLREAELALGEVRQRVNTLEADIAETEAELARLGARQNSLNAERDTHLTVLGEVLRALYITRNQHPLKLLLSQTDASHAARMLYYGRLLSEHQQQQLAAFQTILDEIVSVNRSLENRLQNLGQQRQRLASEAQALNEARAARQQALEILNTTIASRNAELEQLQIDQAQLEALLEEIARAMEGIRSFADVPPFAGQRGNLPAPAPGPLRSRFGSPYADGSLTRQGVVVAASEGAPVRAVHPGRVVFADWLRGVGLLVIVDHGEGFVSLYGANEALAVEAGTWVDAGTVLATSGRAGPDNSPGLYFEIREHGTALNPADWVAGLR